MSYTKVLGIICLTIIVNNDSYTMEYNNNSSSQINNINKSINDLASENIELRNKLDLLSKQIEQMQKERKQEKEEQIRIKELQKMLKNKEILPKHETTIWKQSHCLPWEDDSDCDPIVWIKLLNALSNNFGTLTNMFHFVSREVHSLNKDSDNGNCYLQYRKSILSDITNYERKFENFDEYLQKILQNIPENNMKYTDLKSKVLQLIKINNYAIKTTNKYRNLYEQNIFDEEIDNLLIAIDRMLCKIKTIKEKERDNLEKFVSIDKTIAQCCNDMNKKWKEIINDNNDL